jgi:UDP-2,4-diacetamido-2,4,6-trideoxy-beta-L-altropyranose hydrolase
MIKVAIRVDASVNIGSGHVFRCLSLATEMAAYGCDVVFVMRPQPGDYFPLLQERGFKLKKLPKLNTFKNSKTTDDYESWLQVSEIQDAREFTDIVKKADIVVVDHYGINAEWEKYVKSKISCHLLAIDDLVREHNADFILDQTYGAKAFEYMSNSNPRFVFAGCKYALLARPFAELHKTLSKRNANKNRHKLLLSMGGIDNPNATLMVLKAIRSMKVKIKTTVLLSNKAPHINSVVSFCNENKDWVKYISFSSDMARLMTEHTIAIGAPGSSSWERACMGLPSIVIPIAENQKKICKNMVSDGLALSVSLSEIHKKLCYKLDELILNCENIGNKVIDICDGMGANRVVKILRNYIEYGVILNNANVSHTRQVYEWQCLPETRQFANNPEVPSWDEHKIWMYEKLKSNTDFFYIVSHNGCDVGVVRLDKINISRYEISIYIAPSHHGKGIAKKVLAAIDTLHPDCEITASVHETNMASQNLFDRAGYKKIHGNLFSRKPLRI